MAYSSGSAGAFNPIGNTVVITCDNTAPTAVQVVQNFSTLPSFCQYRFFNSGSGMIFLGWGANAALASAAAVVPSTTTVSLPIAPGSIEIVSLPSNTYITGIGNTGPNVLYITPGVGM